MEKYTQVKFAIQRQNESGELLPSEFFHAAFPRWDLPKSGDYIMKGDSLENSRMYRVLDKTFCIQEGELYVSYYTVALDE